MSSSVPQKCSLCLSNFRGRRHRHPEAWSLSLLSLFKQKSGLTVGIGDVCVCEACSLCVRHALKARDKGEPYQLRWLKNERKCCMPSCSSADIKAERHDFSWDVM